MRLRNKLLALTCLSILCQPLVAQEAKITQDSQECIDCHSLFQPGVVESWRKSRHARVTPLEAMAETGLGLKVSSQNVPEALRSFVVGCAECHGLRPEAHADTFDHNGFDIHIVVSPGDCGTCHSDEVERLMSEAWSAGLASGLDRDSSPFDEDIERRWANIWLIHANTIRFASAMGCGGDYGVFADGRYELNRAAMDLLSRIEQEKKR